MTARQSRVYDARGSTCKVHGVQIVRYVVHAQKERGVRSVHKTHATNASSRGGPASGTMHCYET